MSKSIKEVFIHPLSFIESSHSNAELAFGEARRREERRARGAEDTWKSSGQ
jgi:hypothetical protein